jgi:hypothetical protein
LVCVQCDPLCYARAPNNGSFALHKPHVIS